MKGLLLVLIFSSQLLFTQNNIAIFHAGNNAASNVNVVADVVSMSSFDLVNGMVVVEASVNGVQGNFILDTGSPGIVINSSEYAAGTGFSATGISGELVIGEITIEHFKWGVIEKGGIHGFTLDISHLELATGRKLMGLIGFEIFEQFELFFDYPNEVVNVYSASNASIYRKENPLLEIPFNLCGHLPVIPVKVGNKKAYLGLDSGAEANLLNNSFFKHLNKSFMRNNVRETVVGLDQEGQEVDAAILQSASIKKHKLPEMKFLFMDLGVLSNQFESRFDGLLGFPFFKQHAISINYNEKKIYIWN